MSGALRYTALSIRSKSLAIALLVVAAVVVAAPPSVASTADPEYSELRQFYTEWGVDQATQDSVIAKFASTGWVDAMGGVEPVARSSVSEAGKLIEVRTYPDGSISVVTIEDVVPDPKRSGAVASKAIASVSGCTTTSGSGWVHYGNCKVTLDDGIVSRGFRVSYEKYAGAYAKIISSSDSFASSNYGTLDGNPVRAYWRPKSTAVQKAVVKYRCYYTSWNSASGGDVYVSFWLDRYGNWTISAS